MTDPHAGPPATWWLLILDEQASFGHNELAQAAHPAVPFGPRQAAAVINAPSNAVVAVERGDLRAIQVIVEEARRRGIHLALLHTGVFPKNALESFDEHHRIRSGDHDHVPIVVTVGTGDDNGATRVGAPIRTHLGRLLEALLLAAPHPEPWVRAGALGALPAAQRQLPEIFRMVEAARAIWSLDVLAAALDRDGIANVVAPFRRFLDRQVLPDLLVAGSHTRTFSVPNAGRTLTYTVRLRPTST